MKPSERIREIFFEGRDWITHSAAIERYLDEEWERLNPQASKECKLKNELMEKSIHVLELTVRAANGLMSDGIHTIRDLSQKTLSDLSQIPNLGDLSVAEICYALGENNIHLEAGKNRGIRAKVNETIAKARKDGRF